MIHHYFLNILSQFDVRLGEVGKVLNLGNVRNGQGDVRKGQGRVPLG
jgi:hypothetical protein